MDCGQYYPRPGFAASTEGGTQSAREQASLLRSVDTHKCFSQVTVSSVLALKGCSHGLDEQMVLQDFRPRDQSSDASISMIVPCHIFRCSV